ncbi:transglutaminase domain-containing protein [Blautia sp. 1033sp1_1033st1_G9_1033SCRN_220408]|uniref:transglutaminase domain-containing protein n=1 Tax=Blautia sp. 1033sp1_1033st1_G9_1033SCRN_220408 TaxID=3144490 RepID=UPI0034A40B71
MKKRNQILAGVLAVLLGVSPSGVYGEAFYDVEDVADTDAVAQEITDVQDEESEQPEEVTAGEEGQETEFTAGINPEAEENLFTDHADTNVQDPQEGTILEYVEEELDSPLIVNGEPGDTDGIHVFSLKEYDGSYGNQLDGMALEVYNTYVSNLFVNYSTFNGVSYEYQASKPVTFEANVQDNQLVQDEAYDEAILQVRVNMQAALDAFTYDYPEVFWMRGSGYSYSISSKKQNGKYTGVISKFTMKPSLVDGYNTNITDNMNNFLKNADAAATQIAADTNGKSLYEKVKAIHDYVCEKAVYDAQNNLRVHSAGPMFIGDGHVVCEGYAKAMLILCRKLGIDCACIGGFARNSSASSGEAHMWNYVKMDNDTWYLVDATWDDQLSGIRTTYLLAGWNSKGFNHNTLREERTEKDTFSSPTKYTPQAFIYPLISDNSYLTDIIGKIFLSQAAASMESDAYAYTGNAIRPEVQVVCNGKVLAKDTDYRVIYKDNQDIGTAEVTIHGIGEYIGNITIRFQIYCGHNNMLHTEGKKATCTEAGKAEYWYCSVCEKYFSDEAGTKETTLADTVLPATGHQLNKTDSKAATCTEAGNTEYWTCNICGKYFSDEAGTNEIRLADTVIPATGHHYGGYQLTKEATALEEGIRTAYCSCGAYVTVAVPALTPSIKLNVSSLRLRVKQKYTVKVTGLAKGDSVVSWSTGNKKIARVSQKGVVTGKARGNTIITIRLASGYTKKIRVYVQKGIVKTTALKISNTRLMLKKGRSYTLRTTVAPVTSQEKVTFKSSNSKIVSVNAKGKIYAKKKGKARITVRSGKKRRVCVVTVK